MKYIIFSLTFFSLTSCNRNVYTSSGQSLEKVLIRSTPRTSGFISGSFEVKLDGSIEVLDTFFSFQKGYSPVDQTNFIKKISTINFPSKWTGFTFEYVIGLDYDSPLEKENRIYGLANLQWFFGNYEPKRNYVKRKGKIYLRPIIFHAVAH